MRPTRPSAPNAPTLLMLALACALAAVGACGKTKPDGATGTAGTTGGAGTGGGGAGGGATGRALVTVSGSVAPHPLNAALDANAELTQLKVAIVDPTTVLTNPTAPPLGSMTLDTTAANCDAATGCKFSLSGVDLTNVTLGLVGTAEDLRAGSDRLWVKTGTGMGTGAFVRDEKMTRAPITDRRGFIVSRKLEAKLAAYVAATLGTTLAAGDLEARGFMIGHVVEAPVAGHDPAGIAGAKVVAGCEAATTGCPFDLIYPNADFTGKGAATSSSGIFLAIPKTAASFVTTWDVLPPTGDTRTWPQHLAGANPNNAFVIILPANE